MIRAAKEYLSGTAEPRCRGSIRVLAMTLAAVVAFGTGLNVSADDFDQHAIRLFDGETLEGWEGSQHWFRVEGDAIVAGRLDEPIPHNEFLCTKKSHGDFELRLEAKLVGDGNNAGIQFRSRRIPNSSEVSGYQADMGAARDRPIWGALYDESRRRTMLVEPEPERLREIVREGEWNEFRIRCKGKRIEIFLNGVRTVDYTEPDDSIPREGVIGLQIHSGAPSEASYRNLRVRPL